jgi:hypothetical protein
LFRKFISSVSDQFTELSTPEKGSTHIPPIQHKRTTGPDHKNLFVVTTMDTTPATSTPHALFARAAQFPDAPAYHTKVGDSWKV